MTVEEPRSPGGSLMSRVFSFLLHPQQAWDEIEAEVATPGELMRNYVAPLAAIPPVCRAVRDLAFGGGEVFGIHYSLSPGAVVAQQLAAYLLTLGGVFVLAAIIDTLAKTYGGVRSHSQAMKVAAYAGTATWVSGVFLLLPGVGGLLALLGAFYSLYLLWLGLPKLMRSDPGRTTVYFVVTVVVGVLLALLVGSLVGRILNLGRPLSLD